MDEDKIREILFKKVDSYSALKDIEGEAVVTTSMVKALSKLMNRGKKWSVLNVVGKVNLGIALRFGAVIIVLVVIII